MKNTKYYKSLYNELLCIKMDGDGCRFELKKLILAKLEKHLFQMKGYCV
jgi:hypothetical protein